MKPSVTINGLKAGTWDVIGWVPIDDTLSFALGYNEKECDPYGTWRAVSENGSTEFHTGRYFRDFKEAVRDLGERVALWI